MFITIDRLYPCLMRCHCGWDRPVVIVTKCTGECIAIHADVYIPYKGSLVIGFGPAAACRPGRCREARRRARGTRRCWGRCRSWPRARGPCWRGSSEDQQRERGGWAGHGFNVHLPNPDYKGLATTFDRKVNPRRLCPRRGLTPGLDARFQRCKAASWVRVGSILSISAR
jgi:hypothetical protein